MHLCTSSELTHQQDQKTIVLEHKSKLQGKYAQKHHQKQITS